MAMAAATAASTSVDVSVAGVTASINWTKIHNSPMVLVRGGRDPILECSVRTPQGAFHFHIHVRSTDVRGSTYVTPVGSRTRTVGDTISSSIFEWMQGHSNYDTLRAEALGS